MKQICLFYVKYTFLRVLHFMKLYLSLFITCRVAAAPREALHYWWLFCTM